MDLRSREILLPAAIIGISAVLLGIYGFRKETAMNPYKNKHLLNKGLDAPCIWLYYDESDVNSRWWADFGARSSRVLNLPFLNLCYERISRMNNNHYRIEVISGLTDLASRLGGWQELPKPLQNPLANVGDAELNWIRAEILCRFGGLWVSPTNICLKPFPEIPYDKIYFFGTDPDETYTGVAGGYIPSMYAVGVGRKEHPVFERWAQAAFDRLEKRGGGQQFRGDAKWDYVEFAQKSPDVQMYGNLELSRLPSGKRIQLEDLMMAGQEGSTRFKVSDQIYAPVPWPELRERRFYGWFLRMNEEQIMTSDLAISYLFQAS